MNFHFEILRVECIGHFQDKVEESVSYIKVNDWSKFFPLSVDSLLEGFCS